MRALAVALGWAMVGAIVWLSLMAAPPRLDFQESDKLNHVIGYGALMLWFAQLYPRTRTRLAYAAAFIAMGIALELAQGWLGHRRSDALDILANSVGLLLGFGAALVLPRLFRP